MASKNTNNATRDPVIIISLLDVIINDVVCFVVGTDIVVDCSFICLLVSAYYMIFIDYCTRNRH